MRGLQDVSFENEGKIRRALVSLSIFTLVISNVELASNRLDFFGLEIVISIEKITAVLRLSLVLLLIGLFLLLAERIPRLIARLLRIRDEKWWEKLLPEIAAFQGGNGPRTEREYYEGREQAFPDWDDKALIEKDLRSEKRKLVLSYFRPITLFSRSMTKYVFPVGLAVIALFFPQSILALG